jgi:hypothetical protein
MHNEIFNWALRNNPNVEQFRRSMLPFYLLKEDKDWKYPRYIEFSNLALNLCDKTSIKVKVILEHKLWIRLQEIKRMFGNNEDTPIDMLQPELGFDNFYLLKTARSLIEEIK